MTGPNPERSSGDGELVAVALGDAAALTTGGLLAGATLDGNELGASLAGAVDAAGDEMTGALLATDPE
jgi:hypothetical protein